MPLRRGVNLSSGGGRGGHRREERWSEAKPRRVKSQEKRAHQGAGIASETLAGASRWSQPRPPRSSGARNVPPLSTDTPAKGRRSRSAIPAFQQAATIEVCTRIEETRRG